MSQSNYVVHLLGDDKLTPLLNNTKKALEDLGNKAPKLEEIQKSFDKISNSTVPLSRKIKDIKKALEQMKVEGLDNTKEGQELWQKLSAAARQYNEALNQVNQATKEDADITTQLRAKVAELRAEMEKMALTGQDGSPMFKEMAKQVAELEQRQQNASNSVNNAIQGSSGKKGFDLKEIGQQVASKAGLGEAFGAVAGAVNPATIAVGAVAGTMVAAGKATAEFETHLNSLQALTGMTDEDIKTISKDVIDMSKGFNSSASEIVDAMKLIGSQAPELLKDKDALLEVSKAANVLSEAAEISVEDAAKAITGTMNQMGVSATEATNIINTFAAGSQQGSADVAYLNKAFEKSGTAASSAGMNYVELAAAIESIAPKFSSADVAGSQLASTLLKLSMSGEKDLMPSVVGMSKALENLAKREMDDVEMKNLVGESNITMLKSLIDARNQFDSYTESLNGTNTAFEQMETNNKGFSGTLRKLESTWDALLLKIGQTKAMQTIMDEIGIIIDAISEMIDVIGEVIDSFNLFEGVGDNLKLFKLLWDSLVMAIKAVGIAIEIVVAFCAKAWNNMLDGFKAMGKGIKDAWDSVSKKLMKNEFVQKLIEYFQKIKNAFIEMINGLKKAWNNFVGSLGLDKLKAETEEDIKKKKEKEEYNKLYSEVEQIANRLNNKQEKGISQSKTEDKTSKSTVKKETIDYLVSIDDKTLDTAEKKLSAWQNKQKTIKIDDVEGLEKCKAEIKKWTDEVNKRKLIIEIGNTVFDSLNNLQSQLKTFEDQKKEIEFTIEVSSLNGNSIESETNKLSDLNNVIKELKSEILIETIKIGFKPEIEKGSKADLENEIKKLEDVKTVLFQTKADPETLKKVDSQIESYKEKLEAEEIRLGIKPEIEDGSLNEIKKRIKEKEAEIALALNTKIDSESMKKMQADLDNLRKEEEAKEIELGVKTNIPTIRKQKENWEQGSWQDKKESLSNANSMVKEIQENYKLKLIGKEEVESQLAEINSLLEQLGLKPITLTFNDDGTLTTAIEDLNRFKDQMSQVSNITSSMGNVFNSLGSAIGGTTGEVMSFAAQSLNAISQIIPQITSIIAAKQAEAMASGTASAASMPFPANIGAIASIVATIAGIFASLPKFESGGVVGGTSYYGDKLLARVNSGELILNKKQQSKLYKALDTPDLGSSTLKGDVNFTISGAALKGTLRNYENKMSKIK